MGDVPQAQSQCQSVSGLHPCGVWGSGGGVGASRDLHHVKVRIQAGLQRIQEVHALQRIKARLPRDRGDGDGGGLMVTSWTGVGNAQPVGGRIMDLCSYRQEGILECQPWYGAQGGEGCRPPCG